MTATLLRRSAVLAALAATLFISPSPAAADPAMVTVCSITGFCYCVRKDLLDDINKNITDVRQAILAQRKKGKLIGYLSIPLSTTGGSYFGVNADVAGATAKRLQERFGEDAVWIMNPATQGHLPAGASGAEYMYMWTKVLEGGNGLGDDFTFVYFTGPASFAQLFKLDGKDDLKKIDDYFDQRLATDTQLQDAVKRGDVSKTTFRTYYGLRASVSFSYGSHDEWNIARTLNVRRRATPDLGIANQISILFDGHEVAPAAFEGTIAAGDAGRCVN